MLFIRNTHRKAIRNRRRILSTFERLEDRAVPSTLTVTSASDHGNGTLRAALVSASPGDTIQFAPQLSGQTITLNTGELVVTKSLSIQGPGANRLTISGNHASRVFDIQSLATVTLSGLTIANGNVTGDGSNPTDLGGGGILDEAGASLILDHCTLAGNVANAASDTVDVFGGGLLNEGSATVIACTFTDNQALGGGGGSFFGASVGGGIDNFGGATLTVVNSAFVNNDALGAGAGNYGIGGAIESNAGFLAGPPTPSTAVITGSVFTGNQAGGGGGILGNGGAIDNEGPGSLMTVSSSTVRNNTSKDGPGGGLMNFADSTMNVVGCTLTGNQSLAESSGIGIANGGGIENASATMTVSNCTLSGNQALGGGGAGGSARGSGEGVGGGILNVNGATLTVVDSTLTANRAIGGNNMDTSAATGYPINGGGLGGGIGNLLGSTLTVIDSNLSGNVARGGDNSAGVGSPGLGGGIQNNGSALTVIGGTLSGNEAIGGSGKSGGGFGSGGGLDESTQPPVPHANEFPATASIIGCILTSNQAIGGNGGAGAGGGSGLGGAIDVGFYSLVIAGYTDPSALTLTGSAVDGNAALGGDGGQGGNGGVGQGGGLAVQAGSTANVTDSTLMRDVADDGSNGHGVGRYR
jgi:hypothetical protein